MHAREGDRRQETPRLQRKVRNGDRFSTVR